MNKSAQCLMVLVGMIGSMNLSHASSVLAVSSSSMAASTVAEQTAQNRARLLLKDFYAVKLRAIWAAFTPAVKAQWGTLANFTEYRQTGVQQFGAEKELVSEQTFSRDGRVYYVRSATFEQAPQVVWAVTFGFDQLGRISEFGIDLEHDRSNDQVALLMGSRQVSLDS